MKRIDPKESCPGTVAKPVGTSSEVMSITFAMYSISRVCCQHNRDLLLSSSFWYQQQRNSISFPSKSTDRTA